MPTCCAAWTLSPEGCWADKYAPLVITRERVIQYSVYVR